MMNDLVRLLREDSWPAWARVRRPLLWMVVILLVATILRVYGLNNLSPPGLEHDEVANWLIDRTILEGRLEIYFQEAYGHEAGFHYLQALSVGLLGDHALALRLPAAYAGLLVVALQFALTRRLFGTTTAVFSAALLATLFWSVFYSRLGLRAISLPLVSGFSLYAWWQAWPQTPERSPANRAFWFALAGLLAGLSLYTYMAARAVPIFYVVFTCYLILFHGRMFRENWSGIMLFWGVQLLVALPIVIYLATHPGAEFRVSEIDAPLRALMIGDMGPVMANMVKIGGMFGLDGDPLWRQNVAGQPVFCPLLALLFYGGLLLALLRLKRSPYAYLLLWLGMSAVPSLVTLDAPSSIRMINSLLVVTVFPVLVINIAARLSPFSSRLSTVLAYLLGFALIATQIWRTSAAIYHTWPQNEEVQFVWQKALTDMAGYLDASPKSSQVAIGGWSPSTMDPPTMALSMRRDDLALRFFGSDSQTAPVSTVIIPGWGAVLTGNTALPDQPARLMRPVIRELSQGIESQLGQWSTVDQPEDSFVLYRLSSPSLAAGTVLVGETFGDELRLIAYRPPENPAVCATDGCAVLTYWQVLSAISAPRRFFLHAVDEEGNLSAQHDGLDAPAQWWHEGDLLVQEHSLPPSAEIGGELRLGVYNPQDGRRLLLPDGRDYFILQKAN